MFRQQRHKLGGAFLKLVSRRRVAPTKLGAQEAHHAVDSSVSGKISSLQETPQSRFDAPEVHHPKTALMDTSPHVVAQHEVVIRWNGSAAARAVTEAGRALHFRAWEAGPRGAIDSTQSSVSVGASL